MADQTFYTPGDRKIKDTHIEEFETERGLLTTAFQGIRDEIDALKAAPMPIQHIEHLVSVGGHVAPAPTENITVEACDDLEAVCGFASIGSPAAGGATWDILVNGTSIPTGGPLVVGGSPDTPIPIPFATTSVSKGDKIVYRFSDGGAPSGGAAVNVQWQKTLS